MRPILQMEELSLGLGNFLQWLELGFRPRPGCQWSLSWEPLQDCATHVLSALREQGPGADFSPPPAPRDRSARGRDGCVFMELNCALRRSLCPWAWVSVAEMCHYPCEILASLSPVPPPYLPRCQRPGRRCKTLGNGFSHDL